MVWTTSINLFVRPIFVPNKDSSIKQLDLFCNITIQLGHGYKPNFKLTGYGPPNGLRRETINKPGCFCTVYWWLKVYGNFLLQFNSIQFNSIEPRKVSGDWVVKRLQNTNTFCRRSQAHLEMTQLWTVIRQFVSLWTVFRQFVSLWTVFRQFLQFLKSLTVFRQFLQFLKKFNSFSSVFTVFKKFNSSSSVFTAFLWS